MVATGTLRAGARPDKEEYRGNREPSGPGSLYEGTPSDRPRVLVVRIPLVTTARNIETRPVEPQYPTLLDLGQTPPKVRGTFLGSPSVRSIAQLTPSAK